MIIFPAIDLLDGCAVRLYKGDYEQKTVYEQNPEKVAEKLFEAGARYLHLVDLNGAKSGATVNFDVVERIVKTVPMFVELGGGIRNIETIEKYISIGVSRVILGTAAVKNPALVREAVERFGEKIAVGIDIKNGKVAVSGWTELSQYGLFEFCDRMSESGVKTIICTDVSRDGAMQGTNVELYRELAAKTDLNVIASGGVSSLKDVAELAEIGVYGAIIGKAYYTGAIDITQAIRLGGEV